MVAEIALMTLTRDCAANRLTSVDLPVPLGPDNTTTRSPLAFADSPPRTVFITAEDDELNSDTDTTPRSAKLLESVRQPLSFRPHNEQASRCWP